MYVACSTQCFAKYPLERALRIIGELEFSKLDVAIHEQGPHLRPSEVAADAIEAALAKASTENRVATAIRGGMGAREAFETFGVL